MTSYQYKHACSPCQPCIRVHIYSTLMTKIRNFSIHSMKYVSVYVVLYTSMDQNWAPARSCCPPQFNPIESKRIHNLLVAINRSMWFHEPSQFTVSISSSIQFQWHIEVEGLDSKFSINNNNDCCCWKLHWMVVYKYNK